MKNINSQIEDAVAHFQTVLEQHPECRRDLADDAVLNGEWREHACFALGRMPDNGSSEEQCGQPESGNSPEEKLLKYLQQAPEPVKMLNPIEAVRNLGKGTGTLPASFGIHLNPALGFTQEGSIPLTEVLSKGIPDPEKSGIFPEILEDIEVTKNLTPDWQKIALPDMQGPFNIAHMILGDDAFIAPVCQPDEWRKFMKMVTQFFMAAHQTLANWIGPERLYHRPWRYHRIAECSVNMVSQDFYIEHILEYDLILAVYYGEVAIHPCSGPHVFQVTLEKLPNVVYTEAGNMINKMTAGSIQIADALNAIGARPIMLRIGEELPAGKEEKTLRQIFDQVATNPRVSLGGFTGLGWKKGDESEMCDLHRRMNDYFELKC